MTPQSVAIQNSIVTSYNAQLSILLDFLTVVRGMSRSEAIKYTHALRPQDKAFSLEDEDLIQKALLEEFKVLTTNTY